MFIELAERILVNNLEEGKSFSLDGVAADMWRHIVTYGVLDEAVDVLLREYDVAEVTLRADFQDFTRNLLQRGLLIDTTQLS